jgi:hypothetical protein
VIASPLTTAASGTGVGVGVIGVSEGSGVEDTCITVDMAEGELVTLGFVGLQALNKATRNTMEISTYRRWNLSIELIIHGIDP